MHKVLVKIASYVMYVMPTTSAASLIVILAITNFYQYLGEHNIVNFFQMFFSAWCNGMSVSLVIFSAITWILETLVSLINPWFGYRILAKSPFQHLHYFPLHDIILNAKFNANSLFLKNKKITKYSKCHQCSLVEHKLCI